ncbi:MAG: peptidylprolyl isomerase [Capnocytophaga sp.]|nr:peptidylprolyl isomerase [Capnocytophaga sp.]
MKKMNLVMLLFASVLLMSCKSAKYPDLPNGLYADIQTNKGDILIRLNYEETPVTVANFVTLAEGTNTHVTIDSLKGKPFYNGTIFHRIIKDFMIQGGDPTGTGMGSPGYRFDDEFVETLTHSKKGIVSMANSGPKTNGSQFFITHTATPWLDQAHTVFGEVVKGIEVVDAIADTPTTADRPQSEVKINKVDIIRVGKDAENFDAKKVFDKYFEGVTAKEKEKENRLKAFVEETTAQKAQAQVLPSGTAIYKITEGTGVKPNSNQSVLVNYAGYLANGTLFDSNVKEIETAYDKYNPRREQENGYAPFPMEYNNNVRLIPGFKEALLTLKVGDKARVFIPSALAYGSTGVPNAIPPDSDLIFDIEIVDIAK